MRDINSDGGPAFPTEPNAHRGMSLRDYFAGQALPAIIEGTSKSAHDLKDQDAIAKLLNAIARNAYDLADAMLAAREATP